MVALQPVSVRPFIERATENAGIEDGISTSCPQYAKDVWVPTLVAQVCEDSSTKQSDVQTIYDNIPAEDKRLFWIEGTTRRFDGYNYFGEKPELMLEWFNSHMGGTTV